MSCCHHHMLCTLLHFIKNNGDVCMCFPEHILCAMMFGLRSSTCGRYGRKSVCLQVVP